MYKRKIIRSVTVAKSIGFYLPFVQDLCNQGYEVVSLSSSGPELEKLRELGIKTIEVEMERKISPFKDFISLFRLIKVFRREKPYMVHSMTPKAGLLCMLAAWVVRVPRRVHTFTGLVWPTSVGITRKVLMFTDWLTCACATHVIPEGKGVMEDLKHITKKSMRVLGYGNVRGIDMQKFSHRKIIVDLARGIAKENIFTFLFVGRLVGDKGINELVDAFEKLYNEIGGVRLILVGGHEADLDPLLPRTEKIINSCVAIESVGPKYGDELIVYYAASNCFVLPSYREGFPNVVMEAGAMELPSIVTDINGSREIIENGKNGLIVPSKNSDALYYAMKEVVLNKKQTELMMANARSMIANRFEQSFVKKCLLDFYDEIM